MLDIGPAFMFVYQFGHLHHGTMFRFRDGPAACGNLISDCWALAGGETACDLLCRNVLEIFHGHERLAMSDEAFLASSSAGVLDTMFVEGNSGQRTRELDNLGHCTTSRKETREKCCALTPPIWGKIEPHVG